MRWTAAKRGQRVEKEGKEKAKQVRRERPRGLPVGHLTTSSPHAPRHPTSRLPPPLSTSPPHGPNHVTRFPTTPPTHQQCPLALPLADSATSLPAPTSTRLPRVCSGAVLAPADAAVARATRLANTLQSRPRLAEGGDRPGPHACDAADSARSGQPGATHSALKRILQLAWWRPCRGSTAGGVQAAPEGGCLGRRVAMPPSSQPSTQPGRTGRD